VEDEFLVAIYVEGVLGDLGYANVHLANSLESAERDLATGVPLFAILDVNIGPKLVFPFAEELHRRGVPFLFSSGMHREDFPLEWAQHPFVAKPLDGAALAAFIQAIDPAASIVDAANQSPQTLGDVLYAKSDAPPREQEWVVLLQSVAAGDQRALHALYERSHQLVFTLINRISGSGETAEELTIDVFQDLWRRAPRYDAANSSVLAWIMNLARSQAIAHPRVESDAAPDRQRPIEQRDVREPLRTQARLAIRIAAESGSQTVLPPRWEWSEPRWEDVAPGIECKVFAADAERHIVSMQVRLAPGASYPPHTHADNEELHLLDGELWIDDRKLFPGDYNYGAPGARDERVWSETGCTCVLVTSTRDALH